MKHRNAPDPSTYLVDRPKLALDALGRVGLQRHTATKPKRDADLVAATRTPE